ncbi:MAG: indole-3-glycerol phosphate synthase TrpC, partial [Planctomycetota bacterium]
EKYFQGKLKYIQQIRSAVPLPVLRKDFMIDEYQIVEARAHGADAVLLIAECLDDDRMIALLDAAAEQELSVLVEVHDRENLLRVRPMMNRHVGRCLLGVNNRDLKTMTTDLNHSIEVIDDVPDLSIFVSESGIRTHDDAARLMSHGINAVLVGEHLMNQPDPEASLRRLIHGDG